MRARLAVIDAAGQALGTLDETFAYALADAEGDPALQAAVGLRIAWKHNLSDGDPVRSRDAAARAGVLARSGGDQVAEAMALTVRARMGRILGDPDAEEILAGALALPAPDVPLGMRNAPQYLAVRHALFDDRLADARRQLLVLLPAVRRTGSAEDVFEVLRSLTEVELRRGRCAAATEYARDALELTVEAGLSPGPAWYVAAMAEVMGGGFPRAAGYARRGIQASEEEHDQVFLSRGLYVLGLVELATGEAAKAVATLRRVAALEAAQQVADPSILRWHGELAEALVAADAPDEAAELQARVRTTALALGRTSVIAALDRARGLCLSAHGEADAAVALLEDTAQRFALLELPWNVPARCSPSPEWNAAGGGAHPPVPRWRRRPRPSPGPAPPRGPSSRGNRPPPRRPLRAGTAAGAERGPWPPSRRRRPASRCWSPRAPATRRRPRSSSSA